MIIQNKEFPNGKLVIYTDYKRSTHAGADGCFQVVDICIEGYSEISILKDVTIDQGVHYFNLTEVLQDLSLPLDFSDYREEIV